MSLLSPVRYCIYSPLQPFSPLDVTKPGGLRSGSLGVASSAVAFEFDFEADRRHSDHHMSASSCRKVQTEIMVREVRDIY